MTASNKKNIFIILLAILSSSKTQSHTQEEVSNTTAKNWELSFGSTLIFLKDTENQKIKNEEKIVIPTNAALFNINYLYSNKLSLFLFFNLPVEEQKFITNNEISSEKSSPSFGLGVLYELWQKDLNKESIFKLDLCLSPLAVINSSGWPKTSFLYGSRLYLGKKEGVFMYLGFSRTYGFEGNMLWYGVGQSF